jgi:acid phosphatase family membrane protein YuiD
MLDASSLRRQVGKQASAINKLATNVNADHAPLRERMGHTPIEILAGVLTGILVASAMAIR